MTPEARHRLALALFYAGVPDVALGAARGCLPRVGDEVPPWEVRGWLLPYVMDLWPGTPGRWSYWLDTREAGALLPDPIPPLDFRSETDHRCAAGRKVVERAASVIGHRHGFGSSAPHLIHWLAWALGVTRERPRLDEGVSEELYRTFDAGPLLAEPSDYLGWIMCEQKGRGKDPTAFFPTPAALCELMFQITMPPGEDLRARTVNDPCVGTGRMLLAAGARSLRLSGQDINPTCVFATLVNGALYCPWLTFPLPASVFGGGEETAGSPFLPSPEAKKQEPGVQLALF